MLSRYAFCDKAEPVGIECLRWESRRGEKRRFESKEETPAVVFRSPYIAFGRCVSE